MHWTAVEPGVTNWLDSRESRVTNGPVTEIGMWGYTPVRITGILLNCVFYFMTLCQFWVVLKPGLLNLFVMLSLLVSQQLSSSLA